MSSYQMMILNGNLQYVDEDGDLVELCGNEPIGFDERSSKKIWKRWANTEAGERFYSHYYPLPTNQEILIKVFATLFPDARVTVSRLSDAFQTAVSAGEFAEPTTPEPRALMPRNERGQFENPLVAEFHAMLNDKSVPASAVTERMRNDRAFREAVESESAPKPKRQTGMIVSEERRAELQAFAEAYRLAPSMKFFNGFVTIGDHRYTRTELDSLVEEASKLALL